jgi:hypothetical protein
MRRDAARGEGEGEGEGEGGAPWLDFPAEAAMLSARDKPVRVLSLARSSRLQASHLYTAAAPAAAGEAESRGTPRPFGGGSQWADMSDDFSLNTLDSLLSKLKSGTEAMPLLPHIPASTSRGGLPHAVPSSGYAVHIPAYLQREMKQAAALAAGRAEGGMYSSAGSSIDMHSYSTPYSSARASTVDQLIDTMRQGGLEGTTKMTGRPSLREKLLTLDGLPRLFQQR